MGRAPSLEREDAPARGRSPAAFIDGIFWSVGATEAEVEAGGASTGEAEEADGDEDEPP